MGIEIERKFTVKELPFDLDKFPYHVIEQGYLNVHPAVRVRREDNIYYMTYKGTPSGAEKHEASGADNKKNGGEIGKVEYNMPLDETSYKHMLTKADGNIISKKRYLIPLNEDGFEKEYLDNNLDIKRAVDEGKIKIELDIFEGKYEGTILAEVEFPNEESAQKYHKASWFKDDVTGNIQYSNSYMSSK